MEVTATELRARALRDEVAEARARQEELTRKRDAHRAARDRGVCIGEVRAGKVRLVSTEEKQQLVAGQDVTPDGQLAGAKPTELYIVYGWKTYEETEDGLRRDCISPAAAAAAVRSMLDCGYHSVIVDWSSEKAKRRAEFGYDF